MKTYEKGHAKMFILLSFLIVFYWFLIYESKYKWVDM